VRFSPLELRELGQVPGVDVIVDPEDLEFDEASRAAIEGNRQVRQVVDTLTEWAHREPTGAPRRIHLHLLQRPVAILDDGAGAVAGIRMERTRLTGDGSVEGTGVLLEHPAQAVYHAVGYRGTPIEGLPFDTARGVVRNVGGRVVGDDGIPVPGFYATGWIKRGPSGLIGHSKKDAQETVERVLEDAGALVEGGPAPPGAPDPEGILRTLAERGIEVIQWKDWEVLDAYERALGAAQGRERVKVVSREEMTDIALRRA
jgi:ferredoxin--NADP+ reductase